MYLHIYISISISLSLSIYTYIYIYTYVLQNLPLTTHEARPDLFCRRVGSGFVFASPAPDAGGRS